MLRERTDEEVEAHEDQPSENSYIMSLMCYEGAEKREALEVHLERFIREAKGLATSEGLSDNMEKHGDLWEVCTENGESRVFLGALR